MAAKLKVVKQTHVSTLNRALEALEVVLHEETPAEHVVNQHLEIVETKYSSVVTASDNYMNKLSGENPELIQEIEDMDKLQTEIIRVKHNAKLRLKEKEVPGTNSNAENQATDATLGLMARLQADISAAGKERKSLLPSIELPKFDGNIERYEEFIESYEAIIQNHPGIEDVEKFIFLKNHLESRSPAANLLAGFSTTNSDYPAALKLFKDTYGNKSLLRQIRISKLLNVPHVDGKTSLRTVYNTLTTHIRSLEGLGVSAEEYALFLSPIVLSKLSKDIVTRWYRKNDDSIEHLLDFIHGEVRSRESATYLEEAFKGKPGSYKRSKEIMDDHSDDEYGHRNEYRPSTAVSLVTGSERSPRWCYYCENSTHNTGVCSKLEKCDSDEVISLIKRRQLCFGCLMKGHPKVLCPNKGKLQCKKCDARNHHTFLHIDRRESEGLDEKSSKMRENETGIRMTTMENSNEKVIFQTGNALLRKCNGKSPDQSVEVKVMFDAGSDRSYITTAACKKLNLMKHKENLNIKGFDGKGEGVKSYNVRHAILQAISPWKIFTDCVGVRLVETERICAPIQREAVSIDVLNSEYLRPLEMAEDYSTSSCDEIDVLVGLDYYWQFITGEVIRQEGKPMAVKSILGWMLQTIPDYKKDTTSGSSKDATALVMSAHRLSNRSRADESKDWRQDSKMHSVYKQYYKRRSNGGENCRKRNWYSGSPKIPYQHLHRNRDKFADGRRNRYGYSLSRFKKDEDKYYTPYSSFYSDQV